MKVISIKELNSIKMALGRIYDGEDEDIPNAKLIGSGNAVITRICNKNNWTSQEETELFKHIRRQDNHCAEKLEKLGWTITGWMKRDYEEEN